MTTNKISSNLKPIWLMWSVSSSIFHSRQRNRGGEPCMEKWVMMSFSLAMDFHFLYSSSTFFFRLKRDSWGTLFCLKNAWQEGRKEERGTFISIRVKIWHLSSRLSDCSVPAVEQGSRTACVRPSCEVWSSLWSGGCLYTRSHGWSLSLWKNLQTKRKFRRPPRLNLQVSVSYEHKSKKGPKQTGKWDTVIKKIYSEGYLWRAWLWPGWGSRLCSAPQTRPTEPSWGRWGSEWTVAALPNSPEPWSTAGLCSQHWGERHKDKVMEHAPPDNSFFLLYTSYKLPTGDSVGIIKCLPQMQLVLVGLGNGSQTVEVTEQLDSVVRLDVVHPVAEHLQ